MAEEQATGGFLGSLGDVLLTGIDGYITGSIQEQFPERSAPAGDSTGEGSGNIDPAVREAEQTQANNGFSLNVDQRILIPSLILLGIALALRK